MLPSGLCQRPPRCFPAARRNCFKSRIHQKTSLKRFGTFWIAVAQKTVLLELRATCLSLCHVCRGSPSAVPTCAVPTSTQTSWLKQVGSNKLERHLFEQIVFRLEPNESTFCPLNGSRPDESIRSALDYGDLSERS